MYLIKENQCSSVGKVVSMLSTVQGEVVIREEIKCFQRDLVDLCSRVVVFFLANIGK